MIAAALLALGACGSADAPAARNASAAATTDRDADGPIEMPFDEPPLPAATEPANATPPPAPGNDADIGNNAADPTNAQPEREPGRAAARALVRDYFAAIGRRDYGTAYAMREPGTGGVSARAFAREFDRYRRYEATIGMPGRIDSGAGQRYVEVPVRVRATTGDGRAVTLQGNVTLHRTAAIDGATPEQRRWRIRDSALSPR